jgi:hypothetical protein
MPPSMLRSCSPFAHEDRQLKSPLELQNRNQHPVREGSPPPGAPTSGEIDPQFQSRGARTDSLVRIRHTQPGSPVREARRVEGLTTAATVWITAALGIACGLAAWRTVGIAVVIGLLILVAGRWAEAAYAAATNGGGKTGD